MDGAPISSEYSLNFEVKENGGSLAVRLISFYPRQDLEHLITVFGEAMKDIADYPMRFAIAHPTRLRDLPSRFDHTTASEQFHNAMDLEKYFDTIRNILAEVSHVPAESITTRTSIHSIGIDSTAAIHVVSLCRKAALKLSPYDLLRGGTAGSICEAVGENARRNDTPVPKTQLRRGISAEQQRRAIDILGVEVCAVQDILPCTPGQEHYIRHWLNSGRTLYEPGWTLRSRERLDAQRMQRAWFHLQTRDPILRTSFVFVEAHEVLQVVMNPTAFEEGNFSIHEEQQSLLSAVKSHARSMAKSASDLFSPPVRLLFIKAGDGDALMFYIHHSLYDAWTMPRSIESLTKFYEHDPQPPIDSGISPLPNPTMRGQEIAPAEQTFWREALLGCEPTILGCTNDDPLDRRQSFSLSQMAGVDQQILQHIWNAHGYSVQHLILVAFARVIATRTATASPIFGLYHVGRSTTDNQDDFPRVNCLPFGLRDVLTNTVATCLDTIRASLVSRIPFEQSHPMSACKAQNPSASMLPFNTHLNLLMHGSRDDPPEQALLQPWFFGAPTEFSHEKVIQGRTAVDGLDLSILPRHNLFVDFEVRNDGLFIGSMADRALMDEDMICVLNQDIEKQLMNVMSQLFETM